MATKITKTLLATSFALLASSVFAAPIQWGANGHWYEYIGTPVSAQDAFAAATASTFMGMPGYLTTVTSFEENVFVSFIVANGALAWIGASDDSDEGTFTWRGGPEMGQELTYASWSVGEPNNCCGGENFVHTNWGGPTGLWNDHGGPGNSGQFNGYVIEYDGRVVETPEPESFALMMVGLGLLGAARRRKAV